MLFLSVNSETELCLVVFATGVANVASKMRARVFEQTKPLREPLVADHTNVEVFVQFHWNYGGRFRMYGDAVSRVEVVDEAVQSLHRLGAKPATQVGDIDSRGDPPVLQDRSVHVRVRIIYVPPEPFGVIESRGAIATLYIVRGAFDL